MYLEKVAFQNQVKIGILERGACFRNCQFTYLGIIFNYNDKYTKAEKQLSEQGRKELFALKRNIRNMYLNHITQLSLFDC